MYVQGVDNCYDLDFNGAGVTYGDVFHQQEVEFSGYNFELANTDVLFDQFKEAERACEATLEAGRDQGKSFVLPAYDQCIKASHLFNLLDARGVISVAERQSYILRIRKLSKMCCEACWKARKAARPGRDRRGANRLARSRSRLLLGQHAVDRRQQFVIVERLIENGTRAQSVGAPRHRL